jgi:esterase/lipase superfamily enzyme
VRFGDLDVPKRITRSKTHLSLVSTVSIGRPSIAGMDMVFVIGREDPFLDNNRHLSQILWSKGIWHAMHEWDGRAYRGYAWLRMALLYV